MDDASENKVYIFKKLSIKLYSRSVGVVGYHVSLTSSYAQGPGFEPQMDHFFWLIFDFSALKAAVHAAKLTSSRLPLRGQDGKLVTAAVEVWFSGISTCQADVTSQCLYSNTCKQVTVVSLVIFLPQHLQEQRDQAETPLSFAVHS